jgi:hypothetical protein
MQMFIFRNTWVDATYVIIKFLFEKWKAWGKEKCIQISGGEKMKARNRLNGLVGMA